MPSAVPITKEITIREFGLLHRGGEIEDIDEASIPVSDWEWLRGESLGATDGPDFLRPLHRRGQQCLQAQNYVGSVETPSGLRIEILPKITEHGGDHQYSRKILLKMLRKVLRLKMASWQVGHLEVFDQPLHEILIEFFLSEVEKLVKKGLRKQYVRLTDEQPFLKGRLLIEKQLNRRPGSKPEFSIEYDEFLLNRPENRLIRSAVEVVTQWARDGRNQRRARTLRFLLNDIPPSGDFARDFAQWSHDRGLADYRMVKPWCELILSRQTPHTLAGSSFGMSFLFPMEQLFEKYVETVLHTRLAGGCRLVAQAKRHSLVHHRDEKWFWLRPDLLVETQRENLAVLDTKWKRIDAGLDDARSKYGLSESDFYQMAAYGNSYLGGKGDLFLVFPRWSAFREPLKPFELTDDLRLWVVPFCLEDDHLILPADAGNTWLLPEASL